MYKILPEHYDKAKKLGVEIKPSNLKNKKIDVYKNEKRIASIGDIKYKDYQCWDYKDEFLKRFYKKYLKLQNIILYSHH